MHAKGKKHTRPTVCPQKKERWRFTEASLWNERGGALDEGTTETQWFEDSIGGTGHVPSPRRAWRTGSVTSKVKVERVQATGGIHTGSHSGSGESEFHVDGTEDISAYDERVCVLRILDSYGRRVVQVEEVAPSELPSQSTLAVEPVPVMPTSAGTLDLPRAQAQGSTTTARAIGHPMASRIASTREVDEYLGWVGKQAGVGAPGGGTDEFWELWQRQQHVAVHLARTHGMGDRRWVLDLLSVTHELGLAMEGLWVQA
ncbi:hypothetical protein JB92DRAFT_3128707 [Gautieria morchelliformis]|nr:hypothetical protein JB92DRAFT_3128707 [Gautieria morchelliformis]